MIPFKPTSKNHSLGICAGSFRPNGSTTAQAAVTNDLGGKNFTVTRTGTGKFQIVGGGGDASVVSALAFLGCDDLKGILREATAPSVSNGVWTWAIEYLESDGAGDFVATDIAADAAHFIRFVVFTLTDTVVP